MIPNRFTIRRKNSSPFLPHALFWFRVQDAIHRLKCGQSQQQIRAEHGMIVLRKALQEFIPW